MNDAAKVVRYVISQDSQRLVTDSCFQSANPATRFVTHADYHALEERHSTLHDWFADTERCLQSAIEDKKRLESELASLRVKVDS